MGDAINVIISVVFVFLVFSLIVSGIQEGFTALFAIRAKVLWKTLSTFSQSNAVPEPVLRFVDVIKLPLTWLYRFAVRMIARPVRGLRWLGRLKKALEKRQIIDPRPSTPTPGGRGETPPAATTTGAVTDAAGAVQPPQANFEAINPGFAPFELRVLAKTRPFDTGRGKTRVKHVSAQVVSEAVVDLGDGQPEAGATIADTLRSGHGFLLTILNGVAGTRLEQPVRAAIAEARGDVEKFRASIEKWFDARMEALSRLYKMWSRWMMLIIGLGVAAVLNVNPIATVNTLRHDSALAEVTADQAVDFVEATGNSLDELCSSPTTTIAPESSGTTEAPADRANGATTSTVDIEDSVRDCYRAVESFVAGARKLPPPLQFKGLFWDDGQSYWEYLVGVVLGGIAISLGAPFWFDTMRRIMSLRR